MRQVRSSPSTCHPDKPLIGKGLCKTCYSRAWARQYRYGGRARKGAQIPICGHPERGNAGHRMCSPCYQRKKYSEDTDISYSRMLKRQYGINITQYKAILAAQGGGCAICGETPQQNYTNKRRLAVDHCHDTNRIRGILCGRCNKGMGMFKHDPTLLLKTMKYLI